VEKALQLQCLEPDPYAQAAVNEEDPSFADDYPNTTQWRDADGNYCFAAYRRFVDERDMFVHHCAGLDDRWWCAGTRPQIDVLGL
jgi:hypothetical protein